MAMLWPLFLPSRRVLVLLRALKGGSGCDPRKECAERFPISDCMRGEASASHFRIEMIFLTCSSLPIFYKRGMLGAKRTRLRAEDDGKNKNC